MPAFIVATVHVRDVARFAEYGKAIAGLSEAHGGEYVVRGAVSAYLEGEGPAGERVVVSRFPDAASARAYIESATYQTAKAAREGAADVVMRLIEA
jgi:uncharacterized protein (DUF1330 family)